MASIDSSLAESIKAQVLITSTSASSAPEVISIPCLRMLPNMISASTRFLAQPRLIIPTFGFGRSLSVRDIRDGAGLEMAVELDSDGSAHWALECASAPVCEPLVALSVSPWVHLPDEQARPSELRVELCLVAELVKEAQLSVGPPRLV